MTETRLASLTVVATPIGNLDDLSPRAAAILCSADLVACEDTRRTATLLRHAGSEVSMVALHQHNEAGRTGDLLTRMADGARVALVTDAGMPAVSDPGARIVAAAREAGLSVSVVPGPGAVETALVSSGFVADGYLFVGFLPRRDEARGALWPRIDQSGVIAVAFDSPGRLAASLASLAAHDPGRRVAVCRELTKIHEETVIGEAQEMAERYAQTPRGEITVVVDAVGAVVPAADDPALAAGVSLMLDGGLSPRAAASVLTALELLPRNAAYDLSTDIARGRDSR